MSIRKAIYYFGTDIDIDPVAPRVFSSLEKLDKKLEKTGLIIDGYDVLKHIDDKGNEFYFARTDRVIWHDINFYMPIMNEHFSDFDFGGLITWHEGGNAPDKIFTIHSAGDVLTGNFGPANPLYMRNLLLSLEKNRAESTLADYSVVTEATHWSSVVYSGVDAKMVREYNVPTVDIEIGSSMECWSNTDAADVIAKSLFDAFNDDGKEIVSLLCAGGVHFEPAFAGAVFEEWGNKAFGISHIMANQWLVGGCYEEQSGIDKIENCIKSIQGGIDGIVIHDKLKGTYKDQFRTIAQKYNVPVFKHQQLRRPDDIAWINK